jgi:hypothetical protein
MVNEHIWESFDGLWQTVKDLSERIEELETRLAELEEGPGRGRDRERRGLAGAESSVPGESYLQLAR